MSPDSLRDRKRAVRKEFLNKRSSLSKDFLDEAGARIFERIVRLKEYEKADTVHVYASMKSRNEVDTFQLIEHALSNHKQVIVPVMKSDGNLEHSEIKSVKELKENDWGVPEPEKIHLRNPEIVDMVLVPMVAGDLNKNRMGYGKGYYDRFLAKVDCSKIGLLYEAQISEKLLPVGEYDVQLDKLVTETRVIE